MWGQGLSVHKKTVKDHSLCSVYLLDSIMKRLG